MQASAVLSGPTAMRPGRRQVLVRAKGKGPPPAWPGRAVLPETAAKHDGPKVQRLCVMGLGLGGCAVGGVGCCAAAAASRDGSAAHACMPRRHRSCPIRLPPPPILARPQKFSLLGSTGSIGTQTLDIVAENPDRFAVTALAAGGNLELLAAQVRAFHPALVSVRDGSMVGQLKELLKGAPRQPEIVAGEEGICAVAAHAEADACVTGIVGCAGLRPTVAAIEAGKDICLANKETLIAGGPFVLPLAQKHGVHILPADSEHSAIFQCLQVRWSGGGGGAPAICEGRRAGGQAGTAPRTGLTSCSAHRAPPAPGPGPPPPRRACPRVACAASS